MAAAASTALFSNPYALREIIDGMSDYCVRHGYDSIRDVIGALGTGDLITEGKVE